MCERNERNALAPRMLLEAAPAPWEKKALRRAETAAERFGLRLSPEAYERLGEERRGGGQPGAGGDASRHRGVLAAL